jgi:hypothetical protein
MLALLALVTPAFGLAFVCEEDCRADEGGECPPMCTLCATCALPALPGLPPAASRGIEPRACASTTLVPATLLGVRSDILHVPRFAIS